MTMQKTFVFAFLAIAWGACSGGDGSATTESADQALTSASTAAQQVALLQAAVPLEDGLSAEELAGLADATDFEPSGCATVSVSGTTVTWTFEDCTGRWGLARVSGSLTVDYRVGPRGASAEVSSSNLTLSGRPVSIQATVTRTSSGSSETLAADSQLTLETARLGSLDWSGQVSAEWEEGGDCVTLSGTWTAAYQAASWTVQATDFQVCASGCPSGRLTAQGPRRTYTFEITEDGRLTWSTDAGRSGSLALACGQGMDWTSE